MRLLSAVYESARANIPLRVFPERRDVKPWDALHEGVRSELVSLVEKSQSVVRSDDMRLANLRRVIAEFNRGARDGFLHPGSGAGGGASMSKGPYFWGLEIGVRANRDHNVDPETVKQFTTATHLLAYEFGQLDHTRVDAYGFILRNVGPQRVDELGELAFALPVLINYRRELVVQILDDPAFSLAAYHAAQSPAPGHLEYLTHGIVALFDPSPESWIRVAANMGLAAVPFVDGKRLQDEDFQAPHQAADVAFRAPIAAHTMVRRQLERVRLAREWLAQDEHAIDMDVDDVRPVNLWDVYKSTPASRIRGRECYFGDLVASAMIYLISRYFESIAPPEQTGFEFLRQHFTAFTRGFDSRVEGVVSPRVLASAARGRAMSVGLRRFEQGGPYIGHVSEDLQQVGAALIELNQALDNPVEFVLEQLEGNKEAALAAHLLELFGRYSHLPRDLFRENADFELYSMTHVKTSSHFDLLRSALYQVILAVRPDLKSPDEATMMLTRAERTLDRIVEEQQERVAATQRNSPRVRAGPALGGEDMGSNADRQDDLVVMASLLREEFETLVRIMRSLISRLHLARVLGKQYSVFHPGGGQHDGVSGAA